MRIQDLLVALPLLVLLGGCAVPDPDGWKHRLGRDHSLVGRIWDVQGERFVDETTVVERVSAARFVMLGEKHDNADHHRLQARLVGALAARGRRPVVGFEMITTDRADDLARHLASRPRDAKGVGPAIAWESSGWPDWRLYAPIAEAALESDLKLIATGIPRPEVRTIARHGYDVLGDDRVTRLGLDQPLQSALRETMAHELGHAHCGKLPEEIIPAMIRVQRARDAVMADNLAKGAALDGADGGVMVTGNGHARTDRAIPAFLARLEPQAMIAAVAFLEIDYAHEAPTDYAEIYGAATLPFDFVWFTPRASEEDPCEKL